MEIICWRLLSEELGGIKNAKALFNYLPDTARPKEFALGQIDKKHEREKRQRQSPCTQFQGTTRTRPLPFSS